MKLQNLSIKGDKTKFPQLILENKDDVNWFLKNSRHPMPDKCLKNMLDMVEIEQVRVAHNYAYCNSSQFANHEDLGYDAAIDWMKNHDMIEKEMEDIYKNVDNVQVDGIDHKDYPDYCNAYISSADYKGRPCTQDEIDELNNNSDFRYKYIF